MAVVGFITEDTKLVRVPVLALPFGLLGVGVGAVVVVVVTTVTVDMEEQTLEARNKKRKIQTTHEVKSNLALSFSFSNMQECLEIQQKREAQQQRH